MPPWSRWLRETRATGSAKGGAIGTLTVNVLGVALSYAATVLLARLLDPDGFGVYAFVLSLALILVLPAQLGVPMLVVREVAAAARGGGWGRVRGLIAWAHRFVGVGTLLLAAGAAIVLIAAPALRGNADFGTLAWGVALVPVLGLIGLQSAVLRGSHRTAASQLPDRVVRQTLQIALLLAAWWIGMAIDAQVAMAVTVIGALAALGFAWVLARRWRDPAISVAAPEYDARGWLASAVPMGLANGLSALSATAGAVILGYVAPPAEAGALRIATQFALVGGMVYTTLVSVLAPRFALARDDPAELARIRALGSAVATAAALLLLAGFLVAGRWIIAVVFGVDYLIAWWPSAILLAGAVINAAFGFAASILMMAGHERLVSRCFAVSTAVMLAGGIVGGMVAGASGVAIASVASVTVTNVLLTIAVRRRMGVRGRLGWGAILDGR